MLKQQKIWNTENITKIDVRKGDSIGKGNVSTLIWNVTWLNLIIVGLYTFYPWKIRKCGTKNSTSRFFDRSWLRPTGYEQVRGWRVFVETFCSNANAKSKRREKKKFLEDLVREKDTLGTDLAGKQICIKRKYSNF